MPGILPRPALLALTIAAVLVVIFGGLVLRFRRELQTQMHRTIIERDAAVLYPVVLHQIGSDPGANPDSRLAAVLRSAGQRGMLAVALFGPDGRPRRAVPAEQLFVDLPVEDFLQTTVERQPISRYHPTFRLDEFFSGLARNPEQAPVLEVLLPLHVDSTGQLLGVARYHIDARGLAEELAMIDDHIHRQTAATLSIGAALIALVVVIGSYALRHAHRAVAERNERLLRANFELTLAAKASAIGQITAHLLHGLQGPVAGLRAAMAPSGSDAIDEPPDWESARSYTERLQTLVEETVRLLSDASEHNTYELTGAELAATLRSRNAPLAEQQGVQLIVTSTFGGHLDNHRGGLLCLIGNNLIDNALRATAPDGRVVTELSATPAAVVLRVSDEGNGIPPALRTTLFEPGRSGRPRGTGLGLAISRLLARQIGAELDLCSTGPEGTVFELRVPVPAA
ncbi:MAG TPA: sensor histidine kinase [Candidatus Synoicihabitans sp.]|nr:sensor histidine kinase [Candidatus Synoicihabitans sp.]